MRKTILSVFIALCLLSTATVWADLDPAVALRLEASVAGVDLESGRGTAVLVGADGLLLTNAHVIEPDEEILLVFADGRRVPATLIGYQRDGRDLAALRMESDEPTPFLEVAGSETLHAGQTVYAAGSPFAFFSPSISRGIVSHHNRRYGLVLTDAALTPGSSGGPLLDSQGRILGINTSILNGGLSAWMHAPSSSGFGYALDSAQVADFIDEVRAGDVVDFKQPYLDFLSLPLVQLSIPSQQQEKLDKDSDRYINDDSPVIGYRLVLEPGDRLTAEMTSEDFLSHLLLFAPNGEQIDQADCGCEDTRTARLNIETEEGGHYLLLANAGSSRDQGAFTLNIERVQAETIAEVELELSSENRNKACFKMQGRAGSTVSIWMRSEELDSLLELQTDSGEVVAFNDDWQQGSLNARIVHSFEDERRYQVLCGAFDDEQTGQYTLKVEWISTPEG